MHNDVFFWQDIKLQQLFGSIPSDTLCRFFRTLYIENSWTMKHALA